MNWGAYAESAVCTWPTSPHSSLNMGHSSGDADNTRAPECPSPPTVSASQLPTEEAPRPSLPAEDRHRA